MKFLTTIAIIACVFSAVICAPTLGATHGCAVSFDDEKDHGPPEGGCLLGDVNM